MEHKLFYKNIIDIFSSFGVNDLKLVEKGDNSFLTLKIDAEDGIPEYKIIMEFLDEDYLSIYVVFPHKAKTVQEKISLLKCINSCNKETFLKFQVDNKFLIINYFVPELEENDEKRIVKIVSIMPSLIAEFYPDLKRFIE